MARRNDRLPEITPQILLKAYACGIFPMSDSADDPSLYWVDPDERGIFPLDGFHVPRRLARTIRQQPYEIRVDSDFDAVIAHCAGSPGSDYRGRTWINDRIRGLYRQLFDGGHAHTVEAWKDGELVGGLYGVSLRGAFFGESMFSHATDASKIALVYLVARLRAGGFALLDAQFTTGHLAQFGAIDVPRDDYRHRLEAALAIEADFAALDSYGAGGAGVPLAAAGAAGVAAGGLATVDVILQLVSQTS